MGRARVVGGVGVVGLLVLGGVLSPDAPVAVAGSAAARGSGVRSAPRRALPTRASGGVDDMRDNVLLISDVEDLNLPRISLRLQLGGPLDLGHAPAQFARFDPAAAWPLPDVVAGDDDPAVMALQELLAAEEDELEVAESELVHAMDEGEPGAGSWSRLARLEGERQLEIRAHEAELVADLVALESWAEAGGHGPLPTPPAPRGTAALAEDAGRLAETLGHGAAADLARLTAAALHTDWQGDAYNEDAAVEQLVTVLLDAEDAQTLSAAVDVLVGTTVPLDPDELELLAAVGDELQPQQRARLGRFLAERFAEADAPERALAALDEGLSAVAELPANSEALALVAALERARGPLLGVAGGVAATWQQAVLAAAQRCWAEGATLAQASVGHAHVSGEGLAWTEWSTPSALSACVVDATATVEGPEDPVVLVLSIGLD